MQKKKNSKVTPVSKTHTPVSEIKNEVKSKKIFQHEISLLKIFIAVGIVIFLVNFLIPSKEDKIINKVEQEINRCLDRDNQAYREMQTNINSEISISIEQNIDAFIDDITSFESLWEIVKFNKDEYIEKKWNQHFNRNIDSIISMRVSLFVNDVWDNHNLLIDNIQYAGINNIEGLDRDIRDNLYREIKTSCIYLANNAINRNLINQAAIWGAGTAFTKVVSKLIKSNIVTFIIGLGVSGAVDMAVNNELKEDLKNEIIQTMNKLLNGPTGFFAQIANSINTFHNQRNSEIKYIVMESIRQNKENTASHI